jgi:anaerobic carbon-monoxide dehydrogenase iron sulfur subunit
MSEQAKPRAGKLVVDQELCHACQSCMVACSLTHEGQTIPSKARLHVVVDPFHGNHAVHYCHQCRKAPCAAACPQHAIQKRSHSREGGIRADAHAGQDEPLRHSREGGNPAEPQAEAGYWELDEALCDGCGACVDACPFDTMVVVGKALKCNTCHGDPACAASCPSGALVWRV